MIEFFAANLPIVLCFVIGVGLLVAEVFMPGFGVAALGDAEGVPVALAAAGGSFLPTGLMTPRGSIVSRMRQIHLFVRALSS